MNRGRGWVIASVVAVALSVGACATNQVDRKQATQQKARDVSGEVWTAKNQIDATLVSLNNLMTADTTELPQAFTSYSNDVDRMRAHAQAITKNATEMRTQSENYLNNWQEQNNEIQDRDLRNSSEDGRQAVMDRYRDLQRSYDYARTSMDQTLRTLEDVRTALRNDLTSRGVAAVAQTDVVENAEDNASELKKSLEDVKYDSAALADALSPSDSATASSSRRPDM